MTDTRWMDAIGLAELVRDREVEARELVEQAIADTDALGDLNAVIHPLTERARARVADRAEPAGPLAGVPMVLKDLGQEIEGEPLHEGMAYLRDLDHRAQVTSELTRRFEAAGLVITGKTNTPELGGVPTTEPLVYGPTRNPWDPNRTPGGSSGGSAAAVAAGIVPIGHANDAGGSIRNPASRCGLVGLKPTRARVPMGPLYGDMFAGIVSEFAVTRTVRDTAALLDAVAGPAPGDPYHPPPAPSASYLSVARAAETRVTADGSTADPLRIGIWTGVPGGRNRLTPEAVAAVESTGAALQRLGHMVEDAHPPVLDGPEAGRVLGRLVMAGTIWAIRRWESKTGVAAKPEQLEPITRRYLDRGVEVSGPDIFDLLERAQLLTRAVDGWHDGYDALLMAIVAEPPNRLGELQAVVDAEVDDVFARILPSLWCGCWVNLTGQPAVSVPTHWTGDGLPLGVQLVGRFGREDRLIALASELESTVPWRHRRPPISIDGINAGG